MAKEKLTSRKSESSDKKVNVDVNRNIILSSPFGGLCYEPFLGNTIQHTLR